MGCFIIDVHYGSRDSNLTFAFCCFLEELMSLSQGWVSRPTKLRKSHLSPCWRNSQMPCACVLCYPDVSPRDTIITCKLKKQIPDLTSQLPSVLYLYHRTELPWNRPRNSNALLARCSSFLPGSLPSPSPSSPHWVKVT